MLGDLANRNQDYRVIAARNAGSPLVKATAGPNDAGARLDRFLAGQVPSLSRTRLKDLILGGAVQGGQIFGQFPTFDQ